MLVLILSLGTAQAHPNALRIVAHKAELHLDADSAQVRYAVELPPSHERHGGPPAPSDAQTLEETIAGLGLKTDRGHLPLDVTFSEGPTTTSTDAVLTRLVLQAPHERAGEFRLQDGNYPDLPGYFAATVTVGPGLEVTDSSLFATRDDGSWAASRAGRWQIGDAHRNLDVHVRHRIAAHERVYDFLVPPDPARTAWQARRLTWSESWRTPTPALWGVYLLAGVALGATQHTGTRKSSKALIGSAVLACLLSTTGATVAGLLGGVAVIAALVARARDDRLVPWVALLPLASLASPVLVGTVTALALLAALASRNTQPRPAILGIALLAATARVLTTIGL